MKNQTTLAKKLDNNYEYNTGVYSSTLFFAKFFLLIVLFLFSSSFIHAQNLNSATDSVIGTTTSNGTNWGRGFRFSPTQNIYVQKMGKRVPTNGVYSWVIWDVTTQTKVYQQNSQLNLPTQYVYEDADVEVKLEQNKEYILEMYGIGSAGYYVGAYTQIGQHLTYYDMRYCSNCDTNTYPQSALPNFYYGTPDFLYTLFPLTGGMNNAGVSSFDSVQAFCAGPQNIYVTIMNSGSNQIDSVEIHWEVNGVPQPVFYYKQLIDTVDGNFPDSALINLGIVNLNAGKDTIKVFTSLPNGVADTVNGNDTLIYIFETATPPTELTYYNATNNSMDFEVFGLAGSVDYEYGPNGFTRGNGTLGSSASNPYTVSSLQASTNYDIYIRSNCGSSDTSIWVGPFGFCTAYTAPFFNDMDNEAQDFPPVCWSSKVTPTSAFVEVEAYPGTNAPYAGTQALYMYSGNSSPAIDTVMAITPHLFDLPSSDKQIRFYASSDDPVSRLIVGTMASPGTSGLNPIDTITFPIPDTYQEVIVRFDTNSSYNGTDQYIYLANSLGAVFDYIRIDDFHYEDIPSCVKPFYSTLSISNLTSTSVDLDWIESGNATEWQIAYDTIGFSVDTGNMSLVNTHPATVSGLSPNYTYDFYVRSVCGSGDSSVWTGPIKVKTPCSPVTTSYFINFENGVETEAPDCWTIVHSKQSAYANIRGFTGASAAFAGNKALYMFAANSTRGTDILMAIPPRFTDLTAYDKQIRFFANSDSPQSKLIIGTMSSPIDTSLSPLDTITFALEDNYEEVIFKFDAASGYNGTDQYIYLSHSLGATFDYIRIDEFHYESIPTCSKPLYTSLAIDSLTATSVELSWLEPASSSTWSIEYGSSGFINGNGISDTVTTIPAKISGLTPDTEYHIYVRSICGRGDSSYWSGPISFETPCTPTAAAPYYNNFESGTLGEMPNCWRSFHTNFDSYTELSNSVPYAGNQVLHMFSSSATSATETLLTTSPGFSDLTAFDKQIRFFASSTSPVSNLIIGTMSSPIDTGNMHPLDTIIFAYIDVFEEIIFLFDAASGYNGTDQYIYLQHSLGSTNDFIRIDEFHYETIPTCKKPNMLFVSNIAATSVELNWLEKNASTEWEIEYGPSGFTLGSGIDSIAPTMPFSITGLSSSTYYEFYVRSICGVGDTSFWTGPFEFVTGCPLSYPAPYFNDFENERLDMSPRCWSSIATLGFSWAAIKGGFPPPYSGAQSLSLNPYHASPTTDTLMAISPRFAGLTANNMRIGFYANSDGTAVKLIVGTMSSPSSTILNAIDTIAFTSPYIYQKIDVQFTVSTGYNGTDEYIYLMHDLGTFYQNIRIDEFHYYEVPFIDAGITDLIAPGNDINKCFGTSENLNVEITSLGMDSLDFTVDTTIITVNITGAVTQTFNYTLDNNSLNAGMPLAEKDILNVSVGTVDMSSPGIYYFDISLSMKSDGKISNNTFKDTVRANLGGNIIGLDSLCLGDTVYLSTSDYVGSLQWQSSTGGAFTDIIGADSSEIKHSPSSITSYRVLACGTGISDTLTVTPAPTSAPIAKDSTVIINCGDSAIVALTATSTTPNAKFEWYNVPTGGTALSVNGNIVGISQNGDTLYYEGFTNASLKSGVIDTFYVQEVVSISSGICTSARDTAIATIDCLVGMDEPENSFANISIQPNPSKGIFHIIGNNVKEEMIISIYSTNGKLVYQSNNKFSNNFDERIDISGFAKGLYFIKLQGQQSFEMRKIVID